MDENERVVRRFFDEVWSGGQFEVIEELVASDHLHHISGQTVQRTRGRI